MQQHETGLRACVAHIDAWGAAWRGPVGMVAGSRRYHSERFPVGLVAVLLRQDDGRLLPCWAHELRLL